MKIKTNSGKELEINFVWPERDGRMMIELKDDRRISDLAADIEGKDTLTVEREEPGEEEIYKGYTDIVVISRDNYEGMTRIILKRP